jgi:outer membrane receptor protein involved in Fe transport
MPFKSSCLAARWTKAAALTCALLMAVHASPAVAHEPEAPPSTTRPPPETIVVAPVVPLERSAASEVVIGRAQLDATPARSAEDLLRTIPGALVVQHGTEGKGHQLYLRGFDAEHGSDVEVTVDGIPINEPSNVHGNGYLDLAFIPVEVIDSIEVVKGPFEATQGDFATAGSVRLRLGVPQALRGTWTRYTAGSTNRHRVSLVHAPDGAAPLSFVAGEVMYDQGFGENRASRRASALSNWRLSTLGDRAGEVNVMASVYSARFGLPGALRSVDASAGRVGFTDAYTEGTGGQSDRAVLGLNHRIAGHGRILATTAHVQMRRLGLRENFTGFLEDPIAGDGRNQREDSLRAGFASTASFLPVDWLDARAGISWQSLRLSQGEDRESATGVALARTRDLEAWRHHGALLGELSFRPHERFQLTLGGRAEGMSFTPRDRLVANAPAPDTTLFLLSPRLHAGAELLRGFTLLAAYGHGLRSPEARAFVARPPSVGNVELDRRAPGAPEITVSRTGEAGFQWHRIPRLTAGASAFATFIQRESIFDHVAGTNLERNGTRRLGVELQAALEPLPWLLLRADAAFVSARFVESDNPVPAAPRRTMSLLAVAAHPSGVFGSARGYHVGPRPIAHGATAGAFTVVQLSAGFRARRWEVELEVDNLLGRRWREGEYHFASSWEPIGSGGPTPVLHYVAGPPLTVRATAGWRF